MRYIDHIRNMSDDQLAYFLNAIQPEITLWTLSMMRALSRKPYKLNDPPKMVHRSTINKAPHNRGQERR